MQLLKQSATEHVQEWVHHTAAIWIQTAEDKLDCLEHILKVFAHNLKLQNIVRWNKTHISFV